jgi:hypothetical protein
VYVLPSITKFQPSERLNRLQVRFTLEDKLINTVLWIITLDLAAQVTPTLDGTQFENVVNIPELI